MANSREKQKTDPIDEEVIAHLDLLMQMDVVEDEDTWNIVGDSEFLDSAMNEDRKKE